MPIGVIKEISRIGAEELSVEWQIPNFPSLLNGRDCCYTSPTFSIGDVSWHLGLWPNCKREERNQASGWEVLTLWRFDRGPPATFRCSVGIRGSGGVEKSREGEKEFLFYGDCYSWYDFCSRSNLVEHRTRLMPCDTFTVTCVLKRPGAAGDVLSRPHSSNQIDPNNRSQSSCKLGCEKLSEDISKLLDSGEDSDVTVQVGDVEFKVHKLILSARSPVLAAMFRHETEERATNSIKIDDCDPDVFREYLHYLYTGSVRSLTEQTVFDLFRIADKYLADDLKRLCLEHVRATLSVQTFCEAVKLALTHGESDLLQLSIDFATQNLPLIIRSVEWQNFNCECPREANEILVKCIRP